MDLFPERADSRSSRRLLPAALIASLLFHLAFGGVWGFVTRQVVPAVAKLVPRPTPTPEFVALSDAVTIEKRTVPHESHRAPRTRPAPQRPRRIAEAPAPREFPVPTLPPLPSTPPTARPTLEPTTEPTYRPARGTIHHARGVPTEEPRPRETPTLTPPPTPKRAFTQQQMAALDAQFSKTIAQAQRSLTDVPAQRRPPARMPNQRQYELIMSGTPEEFYASFQGECDNPPLQGPMRDGPLRAYYIRCHIQYSDGYFETVSFPWVFVFPPQRDPFDPHVTERMYFPGQGPPPGFVLPPHFALSRAVCAFFKPRCASIIERERANGNQPATDSQ